MGLLQNASFAAVPSFFFAYLKTDRKTPLHQGIQWPMQRMDATTAATLTMVGNHCIISIPLIWFMLEHIGTNRKRMGFHIGGTVL